MNYKQIYKELIEYIFNQQNDDIESTIAYIAKNEYKIDEWKPDFKQARRHLTANERNEIIWDIITPF